MERFASVRKKTNMDFITAADHATEYVATGQQENLNLLINGLDITTRAMMTDYLTRKADYRTDLMN